MVFFIGYLFLGMGTGFLSGLLGIGGGLIVVPGLRYLYHAEHFDSLILMQLVVGTSLAIMVATLLRAAVIHARKNSGYAGLFLRMLSGVIVGAVGGSILAHHLHSHVLKVTFAVLTLLAAVKMFWPSPKVDRDFNLPHPAIMFVVALFIGGVSALLGVSGSIFTIPFLLTRGVKMHLAITVSAMIGIVVAVVGCASYIALGWHIKGLPHGSMGYVYWPACLGVVIGTLLLVPIGARLSYRVSQEGLKRIFAFLLLFVGVHMMF